MQRNQMMTLHTITKRFIVGCFSGKQLRNIKTFSKRSRSGNCSFGQIVQNRLKRRNAHCLGRSSQRRRAKNMCFGSAHRTPAGRLWYCRNTSRCRSSQWTNCKDKNKSHIQLKLFMRLNPNASSRRIRLSRFYLC